MEMKSEIHVDERRADEVCLYLTYPEIQDAANSIELCARHHAFVNLEWRPIPLV